MVAPGTLTWSSPDDMPGIPFPATRVAEGSGWRFNGVLKGEATVLVIAAGECSDGMSDTVYPYTARFSWGARQFSGCARVRH
jgi:uncharacterized membrane protein